MQGIDLRMKEIGIKHFGKEVMDRLTEQEIIEARCETFKHLNFLARICPLNEGDVENVFCEIFIKDILDRKDYEQRKEVTHGKAEGAH